MHRLKNLTLSIVFTASALAWLSAQAQDTSEFKNEDQKFSYALGYQVGQSILEQLEDIPDLDMHALSGAVAASLLGIDPLLSEGEMAEIIVSRHQKMEEKMAEQASENSQKSAAFLEEHKSREGVTVTESGLQYRVLESGDPAGEPPGPDDAVVVHYVGTLADGTEFDSSRARGTPASFPLAGIIPGWREVLQLMRPGDLWSVVLPPQLGYGESGAGNLIGPNQVLLFEIELLEVRKSPGS